MDLTNSQNTHSKSILTPLFRMAIVSGAEAAVKFHLRRGVDVNSVDYKGQSALMLAAKNGRSEVCRILIDAGADPRLQDIDGNSALSFAIDHDQKDIEILLREQFGDSISDKHNESSFVSDSSNVNKKDPNFQDLNFEPVTKHSNLNDDLNFSHWEEEKEFDKPKDSMPHLSVSQEVQKRISNHIPIHADNDWSDVDVKLPTVIRFQQVNLLESDKEWQLIFKHLLHSGFFYGWVSEKEIAETIPYEKTDKNLNTEDYLAAIKVVLNECNIRVTNDFDTLIFSATHPKEKKEQLQNKTNNYMIDEALNLFFQILFYINGPITQYINDIGLRKLLSRDEEIELANEISEGIADALRSIPRSSIAINEFFLQLKRVKKGQIPIQKIVNLDNRINEFYSENIHSNLVSRVREDSEIGLSADAYDAKHESNITSEIFQKFDSIRATYSEMIRSSCLQKKEELLDKMASQMHEIDLSDELKTTLWQKVSTENAGSNAQKILNDGLNRVRNAKNKFAESNLKLVLHFAKKHDDSSLLDLIQEGNLGLLRAIDRFDLKYGVKFSTYSSYWIRQFIASAIIEDEHLIRLSANTVNEIKEINTITNNLTTQLGREPNLEEIALAAELPEERIRTALRIPQEAIPLPFPYDLEDYSFQSTDELFTRGPENIVMHASLQKALKESMNCLMERERKIIELRFGLNDDYDHTLEEIAKIFNVSRERVRQIEKGALRKLAHPKNSNKLKVFVESSNRIMECRHGSL